MVEHSPKILAHKEKATTTNNLDSLQSRHNCTVIEIFSAATIYLEIHTLGMGN